MADLPLWGSMQKAQDDAETIEEAIARLVGVHNDATDAHLGSTRSLETHKAEDVIDHPPGSVLADKLTATEIIYQPSFDTLAPWGWNTSASIEETPGFALFVEDGAVDFAVLARLFSPPAGWINADFDSLFQVVVLPVFDNNAATAYLGFGPSATVSGNFTANGYGFKIAAEVLTGFVRLNGTTYSVTLDVSSISGLTNLRAMYDAFTRKITFFVNGVDVGDYTLGTDWTDADGYVTMSLTPGASNAGWLYIYSLYISRGV